MRLKVLVTLAAVAASAAALSSCATLSEEQCLVGDWESIGYQDGTQGYDWNRINEHADACVRHQVMPDQTRYEAGRQQGLLRYCTPHNGFSVGRQGGSYRGVCPSDLSTDFLAGYSDGRLVHATRQAYDTASSEEQSALSRARSIETEIRADEARLASEEVTDNERDAIRERLRRLRNDRERALDEAEQARWRMNAADRETNELRARFSAYYGSW